MQSLWEKWEHTVSAQKIAAAYTNSSQSYCRSLSCTVSSFRPEGSNVSLDIDCCYSCAAFFFFLILSLCLLRKHFSDCTEPGAVQRCIHFRLLALRKPLQTIINRIQITLPYVVFLFSSTQILQSQKFLASILWKWPSGFNEPGSRRSFFCGKKLFIDINM